MTGKIVKNHLDITCVLILHVTHKQSWNINCISVMLICQCSDRFRVESTRCSLCWSGSPGWETSSCSSAKTPRGYRYVCVCVCLETVETLCQLGLGGKILLQQILSESLRLRGGVIWIRTGSIGGLVSKRLRNRNPWRTERENRQGGG
jgi:hypothetical protein